MATSATSSSTTPPVTSLGSGSSLPLQDILDQLQANEEQQLALIQNQRTQVQAQVSAYGTLKSGIENLQTAAKALSAAKTYNTTTATVNGDTKAFSVETGAGATPSQYQIKVIALAEAQQLKSALPADPEAAHGTGGSITITLQNGASKTIDVGADTSLNGIAKAINADDTAGVNAAVVNGSDGSYLILTAADTGSEAAVTGISSTNTAIQSVIGYGAGGSGLTQLQPAADAQLEINSVLVTSGSNTVESAIDNIIITLNATTSDTESFTVKNDNSGVVTALQSFVTAYNTLQKLVTSLTKYDPDNDQSSTLTGDSTARSVTSSLRSAMRILASGSSTLKTIQDLGISTNPTDGTLQLNQDTLDATHLHSFNDSLAKNPTDVTIILKALGDSVGNTVDRMLAGDGLIATRTNGLAETAEDLQDTYDRTSQRIDATIANLRAQFVQLDAFVAQMNSTSSYLTQQFASLSSSNK